MRGIYFDLAAHHYRPVEVEADRLPHEWSCHWVRHLDDAGQSESSRVRLTHEANRHLKRRETTASDGRVQKNCGCMCIIRA